MSLKLEHLRGTLRDAENETRLRRLLVREVASILGPRFDSSQPFMNAITDANERFSGLETSGRKFCGVVDTALLEAFKKHPSHNVRSLVARLAPVGSQLQVSFLHDSSPSVRSTAARHAPIKALREASNRFDHDDNMQSIYKDRLLNENGVWRSTAYSFTMPSHSQDKPMKALHHGPVADLSNAYYTTLAKKIVSDYGTTIESNWEEAVTYRICASMRATSLVEIDHKKLHKEILKQLSDRSKRAEDLERVTLREANERNEDWGIDENYVDPREALTKFHGSDREFVKMFSEAYRVLESIVPGTIRKYRMSEGTNPNTMVPMKATTPSGHSIDAIDERILDRFIESWNRLQVSTGEPIKLGWHHDVVDASRATFEAMLR